MFTYRNLTTVCCAAVLAFGLAACGSSDDDDTAEAPTTMEPAGPTQAELDAEKARADAAEAALKAEQDRQAADEAAAAAKAKDAMAKKLYTALDTPLLTLRDGESPADGGIVAAGKLNVKGMFDADGPDGDAAVEVTAALANSGAIAPTISGWSGADYILTRAGVTNHAVAYSNPGAPKTGLFTAKWGADPADGGTADILNASGQIEQDNLISDGRPPLVASSYFASGAGSKNHTTVPDQAVNLSGTFDGAPGIYTCTQDATAMCTSSVSDGNGITLAGGWHFTPSTGAMTSTKDGNYLLFGWWLHDTGDAAGVVAFVNPVGTVAATGVDGLSGSATYVGGAAGKAALYSPLSETNEGNAFTADATLVADFTGAGSISGTVDNFTMGGYDKDWSVALKETPIADAAGTFGGVSAMTTWTIGGTAAADSGMWQGALYETDSESGVPQVAAGTFSSSYGEVGHMVGAFGATKQ